MTIKIIILAAVLGLGVGRSQSLPQNPQSVPQVLDTSVFFYDASSNLQYDCIAKLNHQNVSTVQRSDSSLTNVAVSSNVATVTTASAHYLYQGAYVTITGATVDTDLNGTYKVLTTPTATSYTLATTAVSDATYTDAGLVISTEFPLLSARSWVIQVFNYNVSNSLVNKTWALASNTFTLRCSDRASY